MNQKCYIFLLSALLSYPLINAQENKHVGRVLNISEETVVASFDNVTISAGEEVEIERDHEIVDPVSGKVRGSRVIPIAKGIIVDFGLGKASIKITEELSKEHVRIGDTVFLTGMEKQMIRPEALTYGEIQSITENEIVTSLGLGDNISKGDIFLIQRTEPVYDPKTNEITGAQESEIGRVRVKSVSRESSVTEVIEKKSDLLLTDRVVKESDYLLYLAAQHSDSVRISQLEQEVEALKLQVGSLKTALDSLGYEHNRYVNDFTTLKQDIETVLTRLMSGDIQGARINIKNDEPVTRQAAGTLFDMYKQALDDCLDHKYERAIPEFQTIISHFPDSRLTENCHYWIAQSYFNMKDYPRALDSFKTVIEDRRFTHKDDDAAIMMGITYYHMNRRDEALAEFREFIQNYPDSEYKSKVNFWIEKLS